MILWFVLGCTGGPDPELQRERDALDAWQRGVDALDAGQPDEALAAFATARALRPDDALVIAWHAKAMAESGDPQAAADALQDLLEEAPDFAEARYNRAAYLARAGDPARAGPELEKALDAGARSAAEALEDEDFQPYLADPAFAFLPRDPLDLVVEIPSGRVFLGSEFTLLVRVGGAGETDVSVTAESATGPAEVVRVVEDVVPSTAGPYHDLGWTLRSAGRGEVKLGPFHVWAGQRHAQHDAVSVVMLAPPEYATRDTVPIALRTPTEVAAREQAPTAWKVDGELRVLVAPGQAIVFPDGEPKAAATSYERRDHGQTRWTVFCWKPAPPGAFRVKVVRAGHTLLEQAFEPG